MVDESGEDYLYPADYFVATDLPTSVRRVFSISVSGSEPMVTHSGPLPAGSPAAAPHGASENGLYVACAQPPSLDSR